MNTPLSKEAIVANAITMRVGNFTARDVFNDVKDDLKQFFGYECDMKEFVDERITAFVDIGAIYFNGSYYFNR